MSLDQAIFGIFKNEDFATRPAVGQWSTTSG